MENAVELFSPAQLAGMKRACTRWSAALWLLAAAGLGLCVLFCCLTTTANAERMELWTIGVSTVTGWLVIYFGRFRLADSRHALRHAQMLHDEPRETLTGRVTVSPQRMRIQNSIAFHKVTVETDAGIRRCKVIDRRAKALSCAGERLRLETVNGYVAAYEVLP